MEIICKFCGKKISSPQFLSKEKYGSCVECTMFCMKKCPIASQTATSWHSGKCVVCEHNPYKLKYKWNDVQWVRKNGEQE